MTLAGAASAGLYGIPRIVQMGHAAGRDANAGGFEAPLSAEETALVAAMAEGIIPKTDTPGAIGAGVPQFIEMIFADWFMPDEQRQFRAGLRQMNEEARARFGRDFVRIPASQQLALLTAWDAASAQAGPPGGGAPHPFARLKTLTVVGYYTSQTGQDTELQATMDAGQDTPDGPVSMGFPFRV